MRILADFKPFVKGQLDFHERRARNPGYSPDRQKLHAATAETLRELLEAIDKTPAATAPILSADPLTLTADDIAGLPQELLEQLNISEGDKLDAAIIEIINAAGGVLLLDKILIGLYKRTAEVYQRAQIISRIYRMSRKGMVRSVPRRKGVYTTLDTWAGEEEEEGDDADGPASTMPEQFNAAAKKVFP
jgi:hypothetical protein